MSAQLKQSTLQALAQLRTDFELYAQVALKVRTKEGQLAPLIMNKAQRYIHAKLEEQRAKTGRVRALILKGRQQGCSTYVEARFFWRTVFAQGVRTFILTHEESASANLFDIAQRYLDHLPDELKPSVDTHNAKELMFRALDSGYKVGTAGNKAVGRSATFQLFHGSEVAFWPNSELHAAGILQTVPDAAGTEVIHESTANGIGNFFHVQWQRAERGENDFQAIFVPWFWQEEYSRAAPADFVSTTEEEDYRAAYGLTKEQIFWRRSKIAELGDIKFKQEYPANAAEAFQTSGEDPYIAPALIVAARKAALSGDGPLLLGVDPARFGDDRTSFIRRKGREAFNLESFHGKDTMEVAGMVARVIGAEKPARVFVDVGGLGAGVVDRLRELGFSQLVEAVNFGERAVDPEKYRNKRAECWGEMRKWLAEPPVRIPDTDSLHGDLIAPGYKFDSNSRLELEPKESIKRRGLASPDEADALALTFASPVSSQSENRDIYAGFRKGWAG
jgi:hypothetical protein